MVYRKAESVRGSSVKHPLLTEPFDRALAEVTQYWPMPLLLPRFSLTRIGDAVTGVLLAVVIAIAVSDSGVEFLGEGILFSIVMIHFLNIRRGLIYGRARTGARWLNASFKTKIIRPIRTEIRDVRKRRATRGVDLFLQTKTRFDGAVYHRLIRSYNALYSLVGPLSSNYYRMCCGTDCSPFSEAEYEWAGENGDPLDDPSSDGIVKKQFAIVRQLRRRYISMVIVNRQGRIIPSSSHLAEEKAVREELQIETEQLCSLQKQVEIVLDRFNETCGFQ